MCECANVGMCYCVNAGKRMTDFCQTISLSFFFFTSLYSVIKEPQALFILVTLGVSIFCHRTALRLYGVIEIQPLRGC